MSRVAFLEKLLDGAEVEWVPLGEVVRMRAGQHISARNIMEKASNEYPYPCFGGNGIRGFVAENSHDGKHLLIGRQGALCGNVQRTSGKFYSTEHAVVVTPSGFINIDWAFHLLTLMNLNQYASQSAQPGLAVGKIENLKIPIPCPNNPKKSLGIQSEIVRILDAFTAVTSELTSELSARRKQYNHYRDKLLRFEDGEVEWKTLGDSALIEIANSARRPVKASLREPGTTPYYGANNIQDYVDGYTHEGSYVLIAEDGSASLDDYSIQYATGRFWANNHVHVIRGRSDIDTRFLYHYLRTVNFHPFLPNKGRAKLTKAEMEKIPIPLLFPENLKKSLAEQARIVAILDKFDALTNSLSEGLPREIELRRKQYEHYRDVLLSFPGRPAHG